MMHEPTNCPAVLFCLQAKARAGAGLPAWAWAVVVAAVAAAGTASQRWVQSKAGQQANSVNTWSAQHLCSSLPSPCRQAQSDATALCATKNDGFCFSAAFSESLAKCESASTALM